MGTSVLVIFNGLRKNSGSGLLAEEFARRLAAAV